VQRYAPTAIVLALLAATAVAFVTTQRQKLEPSPVGRIAVDPFLSPVCRCDKRTATILIGLRRADTVTLELVSSAGTPVRTLVDGERYKAKSAVNVEWDGRDDEGRIVPDGSYRPRLTLESGARSFVLRNPIQLDTRAPKMTVTRVSPKVFSPDGDGRNDQVIVRYRVDEPAHGILRVDGVRRVYTLFKPLEGAMKWNGKRKGGRPLPAGVHRLVAAAVDEAGNVGKAPRPIFVTIRYIELARTTIPVLARTRFGVRVSTDAKTFRWRFAGRTGVGRPGLLILRAPGEGRYLLFVEANGHGARARVVVRPRQPASSRSPAASR
jgi:flagellar hook capping protein FlgD